MHDAVKVAKDLHAVDQAVYPILLKLLVAYNRVNTHYFFHSVSRITCFLFVSPAYWLNLLVPLISITLYFELPQSLVLGTSFSSVFIHFLMSNYKPMALNTCIH